MFTAPVRGCAALLSRSLLPVADAALGRGMMTRLRLLNATEQWPLATVEATRDVLVRVVAEAAAEVPLYRDLYRAAGVDPDDVRGVEDLAVLPFVTRRELGEGYPERTSRSTGRRTHPACTSGSTGMPLCIREDAITEGWHQAAFLQILAGSGWPIGAPHVQLGAHPGRGGLRTWKDRVLQCRYVSVTDLREPTLDVVLDDMARRDIRFVFGYPTGIEELARRALARGRAPSLDAVVTWGDRLRDATRVSIETTFRCAVRDAYGLGEGVWVAAQCTAGGYHERMLDVALELVDDVGLPVPPGVIGHVVVTRLHAGATPLVRYRTDDLAVRTSEPCPCGRPGMVLERVVGRTADRIVTPTGNVLLAQVFTHALDRCTDVDGFQVVKTHADRLELRITVRGRPSTPEPPSSVVAAAEPVTRAIPDMTVEVRVVDELPITRSGKLRLVLDESTPDG